MNEITLLLQYAAPVAIAALGEVYVQKAGVINIGLEGTMLLGAFFAMLAAYVTKNPAVGILAGCGVGMLAMAVSAFFTVRMGRDQVVVGTALNLLALGVTGSLFRSRFGQSGQLLTVPKIPSWNGLDLVMALMIAAVPLLAWLLRGTALGLATRAAGEYPKAAEAAGFDVLRLRFAANLIGGLFGGLAGAYLALGIAGSFAENMTAGRGFVAIAVVTFGRWKPVWVLAAALIIGFAESLQYRFQSMGVQVPYQLMIAFPYIVALLVLVIAGRGSAAPAALAQPYRRSA